MAQSVTARDKLVMGEIHRLFWRAMLHTRGYFIITAAFQGPALIIMNVAVPLGIAYAVQAIVLRDFDAVPQYVLLAFGLAMLGNLVFVLSTWAFNRNGIYGAAYVQRKVFANYLDKDYEFYGSNFVGALGAQAAKLRDAFTDYNRIVLFDIPRVVGVIVSSLLVIAWQSWQLAIVTILCMAFILSFNLLFAKYRLKYRRIVSQASSDVSAFLGDVLSHGTTVKSFGRERSEQQNLEEPLNRWNTAQLKSWDLFTPMNFARNLMLALTVAGALLVSARLYESSAASIAVITLVQLYLIRFMNIIYDVGDMVKNYELVMSAAYQPVATMMVERQVADAAQPQSLPANLSTASIVFNNVRFQYPEAAPHRFAVKDFSLTIKPGEKIGLVGHSGGGKTTVTKLLLRFMDASSGSITVGGVDIRQIKQQDLRRRIAYVPQEPLLFHRSIKDNIVYGNPNASKQATAAVTKTAFVDEFVADLPEGLNAMVGERGVKLSGGQRQRIAIARALLTDAPILVLDEATSALDSQSERYIQKALWELMQDRTALVIAHRLSTIQRMDRIVVVDKGKIVQIGTHAELLKDTAGTYAKLWAHQSDGYLRED